MDRIVFPALDTTEAVSGLDTHLLGKSQFFAKKLVNYIQDRQEGCIR